MFLRSFQYAKHVLTIVEYAFVSERGEIISRLFFLLACENKRINRWKEEKCFYELRLLKSFLSLEKRQKQRETLTIKLRS